MNSPSGTNLAALTGPNDRRPTAFFVDARAAFLAAQEAAGSEERAFAVAGYELCLQFAGRALITPTTEALAHLETEPSDTPDLRVCLWDSASTGVPMIPPAWPIGDFGVQGLIRGYNTTRFQTTVQPANNTLSMIDHGRSLALYWIPDARSITYYETISPLRTLLYWWMSRHGRQLVHAGAVGTSAGGVLLPAKGGSGKSTAALACLEGGLLYAGDNNILLSTDDRSPCAYSVYNSTAVHGPHLETRLPHLAPMIENPKRLEQQKAFVFLHRRYPAQMAASLPLRAVLVPQVTGRRETELSKSSAGASLNALIPSTVFSLPGAGRETVETLSRVIAPLPHYRLMLGTELRRIPEVISDLLRAGA